MRRGAALATGDLQFALQHFAGERLYLTQEAKS
jgi:hypothetical protein